MVDVNATIMSTVFGIMGGTLWLLQPPIPKTNFEKVQRIIAGSFVGFLSHIITGTSPFDSTGNWNTTGVVTLLAYGYGGMASLGALLPKYLDAGSMQYKENAKVIEELRKALGAKVTTLEGLTEEQKKAFDEDIKDAKKALDDLESIAA